jgi:HAD superfamily hydrolase (TIGR01549 family)
MFDSTKANKAFYNQILKHFGRPELTPEQFAFAHMHTCDAALAYLFQNAGNLAAAQAYRKKLSYFPFIQHMEIEPYLRPLLARLRSRYKTAIASNRTDTMETVLKTHQLKDDFDLVVSALDVEKAKPHPAALFKIVEYFQVNSSQVLYIGDSKVDEQAAAAADIPLVAYNNPSLSAQLHIESLKELEFVL